MCLMNINTYGAPAGPSGKNNIQDAQTQKQTNVNIQSTKAHQLDLQVTSSEIGCCLQKQLKCNKKKNMAN